MTAALILMVVLSPILVLTGWVLVRQWRGGFDEPEPQSAEPDFLQRHIWVSFALIFAIFGLVRHGLPGIFFGLLAGAILFLVLAPLGALLATIIEKPERSSSRRDNWVPSSRVGKPATPPARDSFKRRFFENLRRAAREGPHLWG